MRCRYLVSAAMCCAVLGGLAAGCTGRTEGTPVAAPSSAASSAPAAPSGPSTAPVPPSIAHPIDLRSVRPCSLFTRVVTALAQTAGDGPPSTTEVPRLPDAPACFQFNGDHNLGLTLAVSPNTNLAEFQTSLVGQVRHFTVNGYPAVVIVPALSAVCFAGVGVADHQLLFLQYALASPIAQPKVPQTRLCSTLRPIAERVLTALRH
ncbi:MAG TPA: DUF3558 family protein [Mycobacteriales bacterium]|nr:DUF3558 family protein [Mycobacteriales bacterium]